MTYAISLHLVIVVVFLGVLAAALFCDIDTLRIPNRLSFALVMLYPAHVLASGASIDWQGAALVSLLVFLGGLAAFAAGWMGGGDVKLMAAIALWMGPDAVLWFLAVTALLGGLMALVMVSRLRVWMALAADIAGFEQLRERLLGQAIPYGVAIAAAGWAVGGPQLLAAGTLR